MKHLLLLVVTPAVLFQAYGRCIIPLPGFFEYAAFIMHKRRALNFVGCRVTSTSRLVFLVPEEWALGTCSRPSLYETHCQSYSISMDLAQALYSPLRTSDDTSTSAVRPYQSPSPFPCLLIITPILPLPIPWGSFPPYILPTHWYSYSQHRHLPKAHFFDYDRRLTSILRLRLVSSSRTVAVLTRTSYSSFVASLPLASGFKI